MCHQRPVANADLRPALLAAQEAYQPQLPWCWIPSHVSIPGNKEADALAERGRMMPPLYQSERDQDVPLAKYVCTPVKPPLPHPGVLHTLQHSLWSPGSRGVAVERVSSPRTQRGSCGRSSLYAVLFLFGCNHPHHLHCSLRLDIDSFRKPLCQHPNEVPSRTGNGAHAHAHTPSQPICLSCAFLPHRRPVSNLTPPPPQGP